MGDRRTHRERSLGTLVVAACLCVTLVATAVDGSGQGSEAGLQPLRDGHRVLRENAVEAPLTTGTDAPGGAPAPFDGFPDAPPFSVLPRQGELTWYPCANCHVALPANPEPRQLMAPHQAGLAHGAGRFWCLQCHEADDRNRLALFTGESVGFDDAWQLCGQCHYQPQRDWAHGGHGKRVANWRGERRIVNCTHCHDPHDPSIKPRAPEPPPPVREGLAPMAPEEPVHGP